jgi:hypothetical protein
MDDKIDQLVNELTKPLYVYRMARGISHLHSSPAMRKSAATRMENAKKEIDKIVKAYQ